MPRPNLSISIAIFLILFEGLAPAADIIFHSHVEDAAVDVKGNLYVLKVETKNQARRFLVSRYGKDGKLDPTFANQGQLFVEVKLREDNEMGNGKVALCPKTGDLVVAFGTTRKPELPPLSAESTAGELQSIFHRAGRIGDNRTLLFRFSGDGRNTGQRAFKVSSDNSDRLYSLGVTQEGKLLVSWRRADTTELYVRNADGSAHKLRKFHNPDGEIFTSNVGSNSRGGFRGAGVALVTEDDEEVARPAVFKGRNMQMLDRIFPEVDGNRGLQSALLVPGFPQQMVVVVPEETQDRLERLELLTGEGLTELAVPTEGKVVSEIVRATPGNVMLVLTSKPEQSELIAEEIHLMTGKRLRTRTVGQVLKNSGGLMPKCIDLINQ